MHDKSRLDRKLKEYIEDHHRMGYSRKAISKVLTNHGYEENFVNRLLHKHAEKLFVKKYGIFAIILFLLSAFYAAHHSEKYGTVLTGFAVQEDTKENNYLKLEINYVDGELILRNTGLVYLDGVVGQEHESGILIKSISTGNQVVSFHHKMQRSNVIYIPYTKSLRKVEFYDDSAFKLEIKIENFT